MAGIWGDQNRYSTWRKLWIALAESQQELGLEISDAQIEEMRTSIGTIDFENAMMSLHTSTRLVTSALRLVPSFTWVRPAVSSQTTLT